MEFSFGLKDVITCNERCTGRGIGKLSAPFGAPLLTNTIYANAEDVDWKALPDKIRCFQTGCRAELADVLLLQRETL